MTKADSRGDRSRARDLIVQALYQMQIAGHDETELLAQFRESPGYGRADQEYFAAALRAICKDIDALEKNIDELADRPLAQLDPVERGILLLGFYELASRPDIPFKVVINECVNLARRFGAVDGHKYINALLDRAVKKLRPES
jgi:transcription antitermination protein NusB